MHQLVTDTAPDTCNVKHMKSQLLRLFFFCLFFSRWVGPTHSSPHHQQTHRKPQARRREMLLDSRLFFSWSVESVCNLIKGSICMKPCDCFLTVSSLVGSQINVRARPRLHECKKQNKKKTGVKMGFGQWEEASFCFYEPNKIWWFCTLAVCVGQLLLFIPFAPSLTPVCFFWVFFCAFHLLTWT